MVNRWGKNENSIDFIFLGSKITGDRDYRLEVKRHLLLGRKALTNLNSILKKQRENKMVEKHVEHISLHRHIKNTPSDTEVHAEHQLRAARST